MKHKSGEKAYGLIHSLCRRGRGENESVGKPWACQTWGRWIVARLDWNAVQFKTGRTVDQRGYTTCQDAGLCRRGFLCRMYNMRQYVAAVSVLLLAVLVVPPQGVAAGDRVMAKSVASGETKSQLASRTLKNDVPIPPPIAVPSWAASSSDVRDIPSISGRYSIGGRTLMPYVGAGLSGGYSSEFNRSLGGTPPTQSDFGLRSQFGQSVSPNEFQIGVRIPF